MHKDLKKILAAHAELTHSEMRAVVSHVQRSIDGWIQNTLMLESCDVPFRYRRRQRYRNLQGARGDLTYSPATETVAGVDIEVMRVVRLRRS